MRKDQLDQLVSKYKESKLANQNYFNQIYEASQGMINHTKKRYNKNFLAIVDYQSIADDALMKAIKTYKRDKGHFGSHFITRLRAEVTREGIKNSAGLRLPEHLAKKDFQISEEAKQLMISGRAKEDLMDIYSMTSSQYDHLVHYYTEVPKYLEGDSSDYIHNNSDIHIDIRSMLDIMPEAYRKATVMMFGLEGSRVYSEESIISSTGVTNEELLEYLKDNPSIKKIMEEYYNDCR